MPINLGAVQWDDIDPAKISWDAAPVDPKKALAESTGDLDAFKIAAGKTGNSILEGLKQSGLGFGAIMSELLPARMKAAAQEEITKRLLDQEKKQAQQAKDDKTEFAALEAAHPKSTLGGEVAPLLAAPMLRVTEGAGLVPAMVNSAVSAAAPAAMEYGTAEERAKKGAFAGAAGALGGALTTAAGKVFSGIKNSLTPEAQRLAALAEEKFNIPLDAAQKTGNKSLQAIDAVLEHMPATAGTEATRKAATSDAFTREVLKTMGVTADEASPAVFGAGKNKISGDFERIFGKVHVNLDDTGVQGALAKSVQNAVDTLPQEQASVVVKRVSQLLDKIDDNGKVAGKAYQAWRSQVASQAEQTSDRWLGSALKDTYRAVDDAAYKAAAEAGEEGALKVAREQWRNMRTIEPLVAKSENGRLSPSLLRGEVMKRVPNYAEGGGGDIADLARIGRSFVADQVPNSGTAQRQLAQSLLTGGMVGSAGWAATGDPTMGLKMGVGSVLLPKLAQSAIHSGAAQRYLSGGGRELSPIEQALMDRAARLTALGVVQRTGE